jgi:hypothetical protein
MAPTRICGIGLVVRLALLLSALCAARPALAQTNDTISLYAVDVPEAVVRTPTEAPQACTLRDQSRYRIPVDTTATPKQQDSVAVRIVRVEGTTRTRIKPPSDVDVYAGAKRRAFVTAMDSVVLTAAPRKLAGQRITVQEPNTGRVLCSVALPGPADTARLPRWRIPEPEAVVSIGASFDLLDGPRASDLYSDARVFAPGLWTVERGLFRGARLGVQAGIYQGRENSKGTITGDTTSHRFTYVTPVIPLDSVGGLLVRRRTYERNESRRENTLGLYGGVNLGLTRDLYVVPLLVEVRREGEVRTIRDTLVSDTTFRLAPNQQIGASTVPYVSRVISRIGYVPAIMTGARLDLRRETFNLVLQPLAGVTRATSCSRPAPDVAPSCHRGWHGVQWDVTFELEAAKSGIKLGGEVRGFQSRDPHILVFLAKEFSVEKFADFLTGTKK